MNTDGKDPGIFLGGTWTLFAQGRTLIGVGAEGFGARGHERWETSARI